MPTIPMARPLSFGRTTAAARATPCVAINAAKLPWTIRPVSKTRKFGAKPHATLPSTNPRIETRNVGRARNRLTNAPDGRTSRVKGIAYENVIAAATLSESWKRLAIGGSASATIVASRAERNSERPTATMATHFLRSCEATRPT